MVTFVDDLNEDDIIIAIMGPTGVGKSNFIDVLAQQPGRRTGCGLDSCTNNVKVTLLNYAGRKITLVELPSFNNTIKSEGEVLRMIEGWLSTLVRKGIWLAGILYMHRIDMDIARPGPKDLRILREIYDKTTTVQIKLVTTMWDELDSNGIGEDREASLKKNFELFLWTLEDSRDGENRRASIRTNSRDVQFLRFFNTMDSAKSIADVLIVENQKGKLKGGTDPKRDAGKVRGGGQDSESLKNKKVRFRTISIIRKGRKPAARGVVVPISSISVDLLDSQPLEERLQVLTSEISKTSESRKTFANALSPDLIDDAQLMADYLNIILHKADTSSGNGGTAVNILSLLCKIAKRAGVYPQCYILKGIDKESVPFQGGGFADIYKGVYKNQTICLKVFRVFQTGSDRTGILRKWVKEMLLWANLLHDNVLPFYGVFRLDEPAQRLCLVSPWMKNGNLREYLKAQPDAPRILLIRDVVEGLLHLHRVKIVHGDLKAQNILVSDNGHALIADFGLSTIVMTATRGISSGTSTGCTTHWAAPELLTETDGHSKPTKPSDVWSFGCLCLEIFTGKTPFYRCRESFQVFSALQKGEEPHQPRRGDDICKGLEKWLSKMMFDCWNVNPRKRPTFEKIQDTLKVKANQPDERLKTPVQVMDRSAFWEDMRAQSDIKIDSQRVEQMLRDFPGITMQPQN